MKIDVYTDGSATIATKPGGYGFVVVVDGIKVTEGNGHIEKGTNNDAEMEAAIWGLVAAYKYITANKVELATGDVSLCSDSQITLGWANGTYRFKQEHKYDRFKVLKELMLKLKAGTRWVRGHSGDENNERCDELANLGRHKMGPNEKLIKPKKCKICNKIKDRQLDFPLNKEKSWGSKCKECISAYQKERREQEPEKVKEADRKYDLKKKYGLEPEDYQKLFDAQNGACAICATHQSKLPKALCVDHNHVTGAIRGLLCNHCNSAIGQLKDSPILLDKAKAYLGHSPNTGENASQIGNKRKGTISLHYKNVLKIIDLDANVAEDYDESIHGKRESYLEVK